MTLRHTSRPCHIQVLRSTLITVFFHPPAGLLSSRPGCPSSCSAESSPPSSSRLTYSSAASSRTSCLRLFGYTLYTVIGVSGAFWWNVCLRTNWVTASSSVVMHFLRVLKGKAKCFGFFGGGGSWNEQFVLQLLIFWLFLIGYYASKASYSVCICVFALFPLVNIIMKETTSRLDPSRVMHFSCRDVFLMNGSDECVSRRANIYFSDESIENGLQNLQAGSIHQLFVLEIWAARPKIEWWKPAC